KKWDPEKIIKTFFSDIVPQADEHDRISLLFNFIQYVERQVVLFDSVEDAAFERIHDLNGKGSIAALLARVQSESREKDLLEILNDFAVRVVLTAHPTQFYPGTVLAIITDLEEAIRKNDLSQINLLLQQLGKTAFINREKPSPFDEAVNLAWFLENVFYKVIPEIYFKLAEDLQVNLRDWKNTKLLNIGFWPGGDRDGNPYVTHEVTQRVAGRLKENLLKAYHRDIRLLRRRLTFQGINEMVMNIEHKIYEMAYLGKQHYKFADALINDLDQIRKNLIELHNGLFSSQLDRFITKVRIFGFHFATLDIRQDSSKHDEVWDSIIQYLHKKAKGISLTAYQQLTESEKIKYILGIRHDLSKIKFENIFVNEVLNTIKSIGIIQKQNGERACHRYIISNCQSALHVMQVYKLCEMLLGKKAQVDVVPLFETIDDLSAAGKIMQDLYGHKIYRAHLNHRSNRQTMMLGFSDGTKDGGYLMANWSIFKAKENLTAISREAGISAIFFDGRGGPPARGGGNTHDFYASLGGSIACKEVQITIQGQTISSNYGKYHSAKYNLEQLLSAGLENRLYNERPELNADQKKLLDELAEAAYKVYVDFKTHPDFIPYLEKITPLSYFAEAKVGSRPMKRKQDSQLKLKDLRAIPFVGSWALMKQNIPGFYGVGSSIETLGKDKKLSELKALYQDSLFFRTLLSNSMQSLKKTYYPATAYLAKDEEFAGFWKLMKSEYEKSIEQILKVSGQAELMESNAQIRSSIKLREKIVLPLICIQQYALQQLRNKNYDQKSENTYKKLVMRCMFGVINAARNSA
ncbi:MAG TPA: phosphoenolpyruvate carboxylase, partial [Cyclobacteriaceae bacterium]|nr:phosphoenolpyruvate carboxylase [Cyclobacteriaceae bacterium]